MNTFECFREYMALKLYFENKYDYIKYGKNLKSATPIALERHKMRYCFEKLARMKDPKGFIIANLIKGNTWIGNIISTEGEQIYKKWKKRTDSLDYSLMEEAKKYVGDPLKTIKVKDGYPPLFQEYIRENVSLELLIALDQIGFGLLIHWNRLMHDDPLWEETKLKFIKYRPFVKDNDLRPFAKQLKEYYVRQQ